MDWLKGKVITPMFVDLIFDGLIIGLLWVGAKAGK